MGGEEEIYAMHRNPSKTLAKAMCKRHCAKPKKQPKKPKKAKKAPKKAPKAKAVKAKSETPKKAGGSEIAKLKAALASCEAERDTVKKSLDDMIDIMDK